jgi:hypothetical protein
MKVAGRKLAAHIVEFVVVPRRIVFGVVLLPVRVVRSARQTAAEGRTAISS